jgi:transcriptional regulator with XRE-family HTH domain
LAAADGDGAFECFHRSGIKHERDYTVNTNVIGCGCPITCVKPDLKTFAGRLKHAREKAGFETQAALAKAAGMAQSAIANYESGTRKQPRNLLRLASTLGVSAVWLEFGTGDMQAQNPRLRADVIELAELVQGTLTPEQVEKLREMVLSFGGQK